MNNNKSNVKQQDLLAAFSGEPVFVPVMSNPVTEAEAQVLSAIHKVAKHAEGIKARG